MPIVDVRSNKSPISAEKNTNQNSKYPSLEEKTLVN